ncbi:LPXTG cell wall anchor domain-containing protein [Arthrobacter sp. N199823]|uniref:LPXTG cell wall anchor domain-containing protein n=1 Tax=Arthrobacter sp. N199823 TaxID=2058895 RepID=UPI0015E31B10|nr:LPXTG cell wall anchor domain-containing protein [Arthrobacter sp. N199823]
MLRVAAGMLGLALVGSVGVGAVASSPDTVDLPAAAAEATPAAAETTPAAADLAASETTHAAAAPSEEPATVGEATSEPVAPTKAAPKAPVIDAAPKAPAAQQLKVAPQALVTALNNPVLPGKCGLNIAIVLDLSNSLLDTHVSASKTAAKSVVDSLRGTPSSVGAYTFGTFAPDRTNASIAKSSVSTTNGANTVNTKIGQFSRVPTSVGGTNWDAALRQIPTSQYDIVLFVTDGNPTAYGTPNSNANQSVPRNNTDFGLRSDAVDLSTAVTAADALKNSGTFVMGLGVGADINMANIQAISGPVSGADYFKIDDYDKLTAKLTEIALKNCQGTVSVVKQVRELDGTLAPAAGWTINGRATDDISPFNAVTGTDGAVNFKVNNLVSSGRTVQFAEVQQSQHVLELQNTKNAKCTNNVTGANVPVTNSGTLGFTVTINPADAISCEVINAKLPLPVAKVTVTKTWVNAIADDKASFAANGVTGSSDAPNNGNVISASFPQGTTVNVSEVLATATNKGSYTSTLKCTTATGTVAQGTLTGSFTLGASDVICSFTNTNKAATIMVQKQWIVDGKPYTNGQQPAGISAALTLTGATAPEWGTVYPGYFAGNTVTIAETTTIDPTMACKVTDSQVTLANGTKISSNVPYAAVLAAGDNSYTVTNTVKCTTVLTLLKFIDNSNGGTLVPGDFTLTAKPGTGEALTVAGANTVADANTKSVTAGLNYALSEASTLKPAYLQLSLQRYTGTINADKSLANPDAWVDAASATVSVQTGKHEVYRFVNASVPTFALPLTGGTGNWTYMVVGGGLLLVAILFTAWVLVRKFKTNR